jgi:DNA-directed RNA polymerase subunit RPC12/RpoP
MRTTTRELGRVLNELEILGWVPDPSDYKFISDTILSTKIVLQQSEKQRCPHCNSDNILRPGENAEYQCIECAFEFDF